MQLNCIDTVAQSMLLHSSCCFLKHSKGRLITQPKTVYEMCTVFDLWYWWGNFGKTTIYCGFIGGEYRNRTGVHGFAIQKERPRKQRLKGAKHPLTKSEQKAKVSKRNSPVQNEKGPVTAATVNRGQIEKACQLSEDISTGQRRTANAQSAFSWPLTGEAIQ